MMAGSTAAYVQEGGRGFKSGTTECTSAAQTPSSTTRNSAPTVRCQPMPGACCPDGQAGRYPDEGSSNTNPDTPLVPSDRAARGYPGAPCRRQFSMESDYMDENARRRYSQMVPRLTSYLEEGARHRGGCLQIHAGTPSRTYGDQHLFGIFRSNNLQCT